MSRSKVNRMGIKSVASIIMFQMESEFLMCFVVCDVDAGLYTVGRQDNLIYRRITAITAEYDKLHCQSAQKWLITPFIPNH